MSNGNFIGLGVPKAQPAQKAPQQLGTPAPQQLGTPAPAQSPAPQQLGTPAARPKGGIGIDTSAADRIRGLLGERGTPEAGLRVRVKGGGLHRSPL